jgi:hypothetical protein
VQDALSRNTNLNFASTDNSSASQNKNTKSGEKTEQHHTKLVSLLYTLPFPVPVRAVQFWKMRWISDRGQAAGAVASSSCESSGSNKFHLQGVFQHVVVAL